MIATRSVLAATAAAVMFTLVGCGANDVEPSPKPQAQEQVERTEAPDNTREIDATEAQIEILGEPSADGTTQTGLSYEEYAIEAYAIWYPSLPREEVTAFVQTNNAAGMIAEMSRQLCAIAVTNPTTTLGPTLDDGTQLSEQQLAEFRALMTANFCPSVQ